MNRREILKFLSFALAGTLTDVELKAMVRASPLASAGEILFSKEESSIIAEIAELIIPKTETAGAKEAGVGSFIELMIKDCYTVEQGLNFKNGLEEIMQMAAQKGNSFEKISTQYQKEILQTMVNKAKQEQKQREEKVKEVDTETGKERQTTLSKEPLTPFFFLIKGLTLFGYFTSELGCKQELDYQPIPGRYDGCIPLKKGQKAYAL